MVNGEGKRQGGGTNTEGLRFGLDGRVERGRNGACFVRTAEVIWVGMAWGYDLGGMAWGCDLGGHGLGV